MKTNDIGGISKTAVHNGTDDIGGHRFFSKIGHGHEVVAGDAADPGFQYKKMNKGKNHLRIYLRGPDPEKTRTA